MCPLDIFDQQKLEQTFSLKRAVLVTYQKVLGDMSVMQKNTDMNTGKLLFSNLHDKYQCCFLFLII